MKNVVGFLWIQCVHKKNCSKDTSCVICVVRACRCGRHRFLSLIGNCGISPFAIQTVWQAGLISIFYCFIYTPDHMRRAHRDFGSQIWRFNQDFNFSSLCYFFCLYGGTEIEEGRIRHILLRVYSAAPEIREMAWNSTPHTPPHTIYRLIKPEKKTTCGTRILCNIWQAYGSCIWMWLYVSILISPHHLMRCKKNHSFQHFF